MASNTNSTGVKSLRIKFKFRPSDWNPAVKFESIDDSNYSTTWSLQLKVDFNSVNVIVRCENLYSEDGSCAQECMAYLELILKTPGSINGERKELVRKAKLEKSAFYYKKIETKNNEEINERARSYLCCEFPSFVSLEDLGLFNYSALLKFELRVVLVECGGKLHTESLMHYSNSNERTAQIRDPYKYAWRMIFLVKSLGCGCIMILSILLLWQLIGLVEDLEKLVEKWLHPK